MIQWYSFFHSRFSNYLQNPYNEQLKFYHHTITKKIIKLISKWQYKSLKFYLRAELSATGRVVRYLRAELSATYGPSCPLRAELSTGRVVHGPSCPAFQQVTNNLTRRLRSHFWFIIYTWKSSSSSQMVKTKLHWVNSYDIVNTMDSP